MEPFFGIPVLTLKEVAGDVISGQRAFGVEVVPLTKFGDPSSYRLVTIQNAADRRTDGQTDMLVRRAHLMHCALHALYCISGLKIFSSCFITTDCQITCIIANDDEYANLLVGGPYRTQL